MTDQNELTRQAGAVFTALIALLAAVREYNQAAKEAPGLSPMIKSAMAPFIRATRDTENRALWMRNGALFDKAPAETLKEIDQLLAAAGL